MSQQVEYKCEDCDGTFFDDETGIREEKETYEAWGSRFTHTHHYECCPHCGSDYYKPWKDPDKEEDEEEENGEETNQHNNN